MMEATSQAEEQPLSLLELPWPAMQSVMHSLGPSGALRLGWVCRNLQKHVEPHQSALLSQHLRLQLRQAGTRWWTYPSHMLETLVCGMSLHFSMGPLFERAAASSPQAAAAVLLAAWPDKQLWSQELEGPPSGAALEQFSRVDLHLNWSTGIATRRVQVDAAVLEACLVAMRKLAELTLQQLFNWATIELVEDSGISPFVCFPFIKYFRVTGHSVVCALHMALITGSSPE